MAHYGLYADIKEGSITKHTESLRKKITAVRDNISTTTEELTDDVWKCTAKGTLLKAFTTIDTEVCEDISNKLDALDSIAGFIAAYKTAESDAKGIADQIKPSNTETQNGALEASLRIQEGLMDAAESSINSLLKA